MPLEAVIQIDAARLLPHLLIRLRAAGFSVRPVSLHEAGWSAGGLRTRTRRCASSASFSARGPELTATSP